MVVPALSLAVMVTSIGGSAAPPAWIVRAPAPPTFATPGSAVETRNPPAGVPRGGRKRRVVLSPTSRCRVAGSASAAVAPICSVIVAACKPGALAVSVAVPGARTVSGTSTVALPSPIGSGHAGSVTRPAGCTVSVTALDTFAAPGGRRS